MFIERLALLLLVLVKRFALLTYENAVTLLRESTLVRLLPWVINPPSLKGERALWNLPCLLGMERDRFEITGRILTR
jgi:hypothetical protein